MNQVNIALDSETLKELILGNSNAAVCKLPESVFNVAFNSLRTSKKR